MNRDKAANVLLGLLTAGIFLSVIGGVITGLSWPSTDIGTFGTTEETGSAGGAIAGLVLATAGTWMMAVSLIGFGVQLGRYASSDMGR